MRISDWSSDVCSSDLERGLAAMARANRLSEQVPMKFALKEVMPTKFLPYARHVTDEVVVLDSGAVMLTFELQGRAFEPADVRVLHDWHDRKSTRLTSRHSCASRMPSSACNYT